MSTRNLPHTELIRSTGTICVARLQHHGRELTFVRRVRKVLRFKTKASTLFIDYAVLASKRAIEKIPGIKLNAGLIRAQGHLQSADRIIYNSGAPEAVAIDDPGMVITATESDLRILSIDAFADPDWRSEIKRRVGHGL